MELLVYLVVAGGIALSLWAYYVFTNLAIAIWAPAKVNKKWIEILQQPIVHYFRPFIKWIVPFCLILILMNLVLQAVVILLK
jgi:hypothetical protein